MSPRADPTEADLWWGKPFDARRYHVFEGYSPIAGSLCGSWQLGHQDAEPDVSPDDGWRDGEDCKECARKAGLLDGGDEA